MPGILVSSLANRSGTAPEEATMPTYVASQLDELGEPRIYLLVGPARASAQTEFRPVQRREHPTRGAGPRHLDRGIAFDMEPSASTCESHSSEGSRGASTPLAPTSHAWQVLAVPPATSRGEYRALNAAFACTRPL
jgi:hypothetical protein